MAQRPDPNAEVWQKFNKRTADELRKVADEIEAGNYVSCSPQMIQDWKYRLSAPDGRPFVDRQVYRLEVVFTDGGA